MTDTANVQANFDNTVDKVAVKFNFRRVKDETTGLETKRPSVEIELPLLDEGAFLRGELVMQGETPAEPFVLPRGEKPIAVIDKPLTGAAPPEDES